MSSRRMPPKPGAIARTILKDWPDHLPVLVAQLERVDGDDGGRDLDAVVRAADRVIEAIDRKALAEHFGRAVDEDDPAQTREREQKEEERYSDSLQKSAVAPAWH